jgi:hypothetical protein
MDKNNFARLLKAVFGHTQEILANICLHFRGKGEREKGERRMGKRIKRGGMRGKREKD